MRPRCRFVQAVFGGGKAESAGAAMGDCADTKGSLADVREVRCDVVDVVMSIAVDVEVARRGEGSGRWLRSPLPWW